jgi:hypothetical protein
MLDAIKFLVYRGVDPKVAEDRQRDLDAFVSRFSQMSVNNPPPLTTPRSRVPTVLSPTISSVSSPTRSDNKATPSHLRSQVTESPASQAEHVNHDRSPTQRTRPARTQKKKSERNDVPAPGVHASGSNQYGDDSAEYEYPVECKVLDLLR